MLNTAISEAREGLFEFSYEFEKLTGRYSGTNSGIYNSGVYQDIYNTLGIGYINKDVWVSLAVPYVSFSDHPATVSLGDGNSLINDNEYTVGGLGDMQLAFSWLNPFNRAMGDNQAFDVTGIIKFATGDKKKFLGTGNTDYSLQLDYSRYLYRSSFFANAGYTFVGDSSAESLDNVWYSSVGSGVKLKNWRASISYFYGPSFYENQAAYSELTIALTHCVSDRLSIGFNVTKGYSLSSIEQGLGVYMIWSD